jgi:hypothetical protein
MHTSAINACTSSLRQEVFRSATSCSSWPTCSSAACKAACCCSQGWGACSGPELDGGATSCSSSDPCTALGHCRPSPSLLPSPPSRPSSATQWSPCSSATVFCHLAAADGARCPAVPPVRRALTSIALCLPCSALKAALLLMSRAANEPISTA